MIEHPVWLALLPAFLIALAGTPVVRWVALTLGWVDEPNHRSSHVVPTPRLGGVAIIVATLIGVGVSSGSFEWWMIGIGAGAVLVAITGLLDDLAPLAPAQKFLPQVGAAVVAVVLLDPLILIELPLGTVTLSSEVSAGLAIVWIVSVINAFNFLDGLDGLAAGVALVTAGTLAGLLPGSAPLLVPFAAALAGFLLWNFEPATIFMGDVGSQFVGYLLATAVLMPGPSDTGAMPVLLLFALVLGDAALTIVRRLLNGTSPFSADRNHVFHRIAETGASHRAVAILYIGLTGIAGLAAFAYLNAGTVGKTILLTIGMAAGMVGLARLEHVRLPARLGRSTTERRVRHNWRSRQPSDIGAYGAD